MIYIYHTSHFFVHSPLADIWFVSIRCEWYYNEQLGYRYLSEVQVLILLVLQANAAEVELLGCVAVLVWVWGNTSYHFFRSGCHSISPARCLTESSTL